MDSRNPRAAKPLPLAGELEILSHSYVGISLDRLSLQPVLEELSSILGDELAELQGNKFGRDGKDSYHMTVVAPREFRLLRKSLGGRIQLPREPMAIEILGIGSATSERSRAWFAVCRSEAVAAWRSELKLPAHDLHITLAFGAGGDVHGEPKGIGSLISV